MASYTAAGHCVEGRGDWRRGSTRNVQAARKRRNGAHKQCTSCVPVSSVNAAQPQGGVLAAPRELLAVSVVASEDAPA